MVWPVTRLVPSANELRRALLFFCLIPLGCSGGEPNQIGLFESLAEDPEVTCAPDLACAAPTPYCYGSLCVACLTDANCGNKFCEPSSHTCVDCVTSGDCKNDKPYCFAQHCRQCLMSENCGDPTLACDTRDGRCVPACQGEEECIGPESVCLPSLGVCVGCAEDADCPPDKQHCEANKCVACQVDDDCDPAKPFCDSEKSECVECLVADDCGAERACDMHKCL